MRFDFFVRLQAISREDVDSPNCNVRFTPSGD